MKYIIIGSLFLYAHSAFAVWSTEEEGFYFAKENTGKYPAVCLVKSSGGYGTGFLTAPRTIATVSHVVSSQNTHTQEYT